MYPVLIQGQWRPSQGKQSFHAVNPASRQPIEGEYPISIWDELETALQAANRAFEEVKNWPGSRFAEFLEAYANKIEIRAAELAAAAHEETALPISPRLKDAEIPRTVQQLRLAAVAARDSSWRDATIDTKANLRSQLGPIGPVAIFGPNNFPFAYNGIAGGDFASAVAAGNPVIAKGHPSHPASTRLLAEAAQEAATETGMPAGFIQLIYHMRNEDGARFVAHPLVAAVGYTGSRNSGLLLKGAADLAGKPFYAELSSVNPVYLLPHALTERLEAIVGEFVTSVLMATGQFCTNPGLVVLKAGASAEQFIKMVAEKFDASPVGTLLNESTEVHLRAGIVTLQRAGAEIVTGNRSTDISRYCNANTLMRVSGSDFLLDPIGLQTEAFGNAALIVVAEDDFELESIARHFMGNLTGCIYSSTTGEDDELYDRIAGVLRFKVGRLLNDKMPTGVAVSAAMNHGGPFPATGHPGFTAVGVPGSLKRFAMLQCYDNVRQERLPPTLQNRNPDNLTWRLIDGEWTKADVKVS